MLILDNAGGHSFICSDDWHGMDDRHGSLVYKTKSYDLFDDVTSFARICVDLRANSFERFSVLVLLFLERVFPFLECRVVWRCHFWNSVAKNGRFPKMERLTAVRPTEIHSHNTLRVRLILTETIAT